MTEKTQTTQNTQQFFEFDAARRNVPKWRMERWMPKLRKKTEADTGFGVCVLVVDAALYFFPEIYLQMSQSATKM